MKADRFRQAFYRKRCEGVQSPVPRFIGAVRCVQQFVGIIKFGHQAVERMLPHSHCVGAIFMIAPIPEPTMGEHKVRPYDLVSPAAVLGTSPRISKIEIMGRKRMNKNSKVRNNPIVPK